MTDITNLKRYINLATGLICLWSTPSSMALVTQPVELAKQAFQQGHYEQAIEQWQVALATTQTTRQRLQAWFGIVQAYRRLGAYEEALRVFNQALPIAQQTDDLIYQAQLHNEKSKLLLSKEQKSINAAKQQLTTALHIAPKTSYPWILASILNHWGNVLTVEGNYEAALKKYREALTYLQDYHNLITSSSTKQTRSADLILTPQEIQTLSGKILINQLQIIFLLESEQVYQYEDKQHAFNDSLTTLTATVQASYNWSDSYSQILGLITLSQITQQLQTQLTQPNPQLQQLPHQTLKRAQTLAEQLAHSGAKAQVYGYLGQLYERAKRYEEALSLTRRALFFAQQTQTKPLLYYWQWQLGRLLKIQNEPQQAIRAYQQAVANLTPVRLQVATTGYNNIVDSFREQIAPVYFELADLLLQESRLAPSLTQRDKLLRQARTTIELFKQAQLQDYFQWKCASTQHNCTDLEQLLDQHTAALYPIPLPDRLELLLSFSDGLVQATVPITEVALRDQIAAFLSPLHHHPNPVELARSRSSTAPPTVVRCTPSSRGRIAQETTPAARTFLQPAQMLYQWLIEPLLPELTQRTIKTLVLVPEGVLRTIPFAALHDGQQFLVQQYALATIPGLCLNKSPTQRQQSNLILLSGIAESVQGFSDLPCAEYELATIQTLFQNPTQPLIDEQFTLPTFQSALNQQSYSIVHIASHGQFSPNLDNTFILTYDDKIDMNRLEQLMKLTTIQDQPVDLLTLSACETAVGNDRAALGLAGVALRAGVTSAVASLWQVDDEATPAVIIEFYKQLRDPNRSKAQALQNAQIMMLTNKNYIRYRHPYYWAAFLLTGSWQ